MPCKTTNRKRPITINEVHFNCCDEKHFLENKFALKIAHLNLKYPRYLWNANRTMISNIWWRRRVYSSMFGMSLHVGHRVWVCLVLKRKRSVIVICEVTMFVFVFGFIFSELIFYCCCCCCCCTHRLNRYTPPPIESLCQNPTLVFVWTVCVCVYEIHTVYVCARCAPFFGFFQWTTNTLINTDIASVRHTLCALQ